MPVACRRNAIDRAVRVEGRDEITHRFCDSTPVIVFRVLARYARFGGGEKANGAERGLEEGDAGDQTIG